MDLFGFVLLGMMVVLMDNEGKEVSVVIGEDGIYCFDLEFEKIYCLKGIKVDYFDGMVQFLIKVFFLLIEKIEKDVQLEKDLGLVFYVLVIDVVNC